MFAAAAAAAAAPKDSSSGADEEDNDVDEDFNAAEIGAMQMVPEEPSETETSDASPTAEKVAKAFLESVDRFMMQESNENRDFSPKNGMSGVVVLGNGTIHRHYCENGFSNTNHNHIHTNGHQQAIEMVNVPEEVPDEDNVQVVLVAPRPQSKRSLKRKNSMKVHSNGNAVKILSIGKDF